MAKQEGATEYKVLSGFLNTSAEVQRLRFHADRLPPVLLLLKRHETNSWRAEQRLEGPLLDERERGDR